MLFQKYRDCNNDAFCKRDKAFDTAPQMWRELWLFPSSWDSNSSQLQTLNLLSTMQRSEALTCQHPSKASIQHDITIINMEEVFIEYQI